MERRFVVALMSVIVGVALTCAGYAQNAGKSLSAHGNNVQKSSTKSHAKNRVVKKRRVYARPSRRRRGVGREVTPSEQFRVNQIYINASGPLAIPVLQNSTLIAMKGSRVRGIDVINLADQLQGMYWFAGLTAVNVQVNMREISPGVMDVFVRVSRGQVKSIAHVYYRGYQTALLRAILNDQPPATYTDLLKRMFYAEMIPGVQAGYYFNQTKRNSKSFDLYYYAHLKRFAAFAGVSNYGVDMTGRYLFSAGFRVNGLLGNDEVGVMASTSNKPSRSKYLQTHYKVVLNTYGTALNFRYGYSKSGTDPLDVFQFVSNGHSYGLSVEQPLWSSPRTQYGFAFGYNVTDGESDANSLVSVLSSTVSKERVPSLFGMAMFRHLSHRYGAYNGSLMLVQGVSFIVKQKYEVTGLSPADNSGITPKPHFTRLNAEVRGSYSLGRRFGLILGARGQKELNGPLPMSQMFGYFDGAYIGQGILGNDGIAGRAEFNYTFRSWRRYLNFAQLYTFYGVGHVHNNQLFQVYYNNATAMSVGLGLRAKVWDNYTASVLVAKPLDRDLAIDGNKKLRFFFSVGGVW